MHLHENRESILVVKIRRIAMFTPPALASVLVPDDAVAIPSFCTPLLACVLTSFAWCVMHIGRVDVHGTVVGPAIPVPVCIIPDRIGRRSWCWCRTHFHEDRESILMVKIGRPAIFTPPALASVLVPDDAIAIPSLRTPLLACELTRFAWCVMHIGRVDVHGTMAGPTIPVIKPIIPDRSLIAGRTPSQIASDLHSVCKAHRFHGRAMAITNTGILKINEFCR